MLILREYYLHLLLLIAVLIGLAYAAPRVAERIQVTMTTTTERKFQPTL